MMHDYAEAVAEDRRRWWTYWAPITIVGWVLWAIALVYSIRAGEWFEVALEIGLAALGVFILWRRWKRERLIGGERTLLEGVLDDRDL